jgi:hypothetical protein
VEIKTSGRSAGNAVKDLIFSSFIKELNASDKVELKSLLLKKDEEGNVTDTALLSKIRADTHFLHTGQTTVGKSQAAILKNGLDSTLLDTKGITFTFNKNANSTTYKEVFSNSETKKAAIALLSAAIGDLIKDTTIQWESKDGSTERRITVKGGVKGIFNSRQFNFAGSEFFDWKKLRPKIQEEFIKNLQKSTDQELKGFATEEGSQPFDERLGALVINEAIKNLTKGKRVKVIKPKQEKAKANYKGRETAIGRKYTGKRNKPTAPSVGENIPSQIKNKAEKPIQTQPTLNLNALKAQINARLSMTVIKNMGTPALENRTGRFARSAIVTDVVQTSQGFPSIGYTYQKYPYQTFEPGYKQGSVDRDPRTLIDRSIREIAQQLIVGRFYTRRV